MLLDPLALVLGKRQTSVEAIAYLGKLERVNVMHGAKSVSNLMRKADSSGRNQASYFFEGLTHPQTYMRVPVAEGRKCGSPLIS
jgi:hypothetical protein